MFEAVAHKMLWNCRHMAAGLGHTDEFQVEFAEKDRKRTLPVFEELECEADGTWPSTYIQPTVLDFPSAYSIGIIHGRVYIFQLTADYKPAINVQILEKMCGALPRPMRPTREIPPGFVWVIPFDKSKDFSRRH